MENLLASPFFVLRLIQVCLSLVLTLQTFEYFQLESELQRNGKFPWAILRGDFLGLPRVIVRFFDFIYQDRIFHVVLVLRLAVCLVTLLPSTLGLLPFLSVSQLFLSLLIIWRWRGAFNGGSDFLSLILLMALALNAIFYRSPMVAKGALWYITVQVSLSYLVAGIVKIKRAEWMSGKALRGFLETSIYLQPSWVTQFWQRPYHFRLATWGFLVFEVLFPLSLMNRNWCLSFLIFGASFHLCNFFIFGLNRFFWIWIVSYPAVYYCASIISR